MDKLLVAAAFVGVAGMCVAHPGHPPIPTPTITVAPNTQPVPFELFRGNRIVVPARINGRDTHVMLDTGASLSTLNRSYARSIGLPEGFKVEGKGAGGSIEAEIVSGLTIEIGGYRARNASVGVMDLAPIERSLGMPITAIMGRDFFNAAVISIDWARGQLAIYSPDAFKAPAGAAPLPLTKKGPFNTIQVSIAGAAPVEALFDLGNGSPLVIPISYWGNRPEVAGLKYAGAMSGGVGGVHPARAVTVPAVTLAGKTFTDVPAILSESGNDGDPTQMTNVGIGLLKQFKVDLDLGRDRVFLVPRPDAPPFVRDRAGVRFDLLADRLKVTFVSPQGPAAGAGLKVGDEIVAIDNHRITQTYYAAADWTKFPAGRTVVLDRGDGSKVKLTLADYY